MILRYSTPKNIPYIEFDDGSKLIFSTPTEHPTKGFKWFGFSGQILSEHKIGKGKRKKVMTSATSTNFITNIKFMWIPKKVKDSTLTPITLNFLKRSFHQIGDGEYFPREGLAKLEKLIDDNFNHVDRDLIDDDPDLDDEDCVEWN
jgi:hypothetical protein